jgi:hypothetical protein
VTPEGTCPSCLDPVEACRPIPDNERYEDGEVVEYDDENEPVPWHLKVLGVGVGAYLLWRFGQGIDWAIRKMF